MWELREERRELDVRLREAEKELQILQRQLLRTRQDQSVSRDRQRNAIAVEINQTETMNRLAEGSLNAVTAIWNDVVNATLGQQAARKA